MTQMASTNPNANQHQEWNNATGRRWLERHEAVDRQLAPFGRRAMDRADIGAGQRVLDVGCGCGETTLELARRVGAGGFVTGIDISRLLIERASACGGIAARQYPVRGRGRADLSVSSTKLRCRVLSLWDHVLR
jgi:2-polyprenyl-3-methyl-5-hydroxy-6-metoxy-1,4-benzoquinol methylase